MKQVIKNLAVFSFAFLWVSLFLFFFQTLGKVGRVQQIYHDNDLKVSLQQQNCIDLCPAVCSLLKTHSMLNDAN